MIVAWIVRLLVGSSLDELGSYIAQLSQETENT